MSESQSRKHSRLREMRGKEPEKMKLREFFAFVGTTPEEVADSLRSLDCKEEKDFGRRENPMTVAVRRHTTTWSGARVSGKAVCFNDCQIMDFYGVPEPVTEFLRRFKEGEFADLGIE